MRSSLKAQLGPRVQVEAIDRVSRGSPVRLSLAISATDPAPDMPGAAVLLARRHMPMGQAHRALTRLVKGEADVVVEVPQVDDVAALVADLAALGLSAERADPPAEVDVKNIRARTGLSQDQFALAYGLEAATVRNWEQGRTRPDLPARTYLLMIGDDPEGIRARRLASVRHFRDSHA